MRRTHLRGHENILKRLLIHVGAFNLSLILRREIGVGTPRGLQGRKNWVLCCFWVAWMVLEGLWERYGRRKATSAGRFKLLMPPGQELSAA